MSNNKRMYPAAKRIFILAVVIAAAFMGGMGWLFVFAPMAIQESAVLYVRPKDEFASGLSDKAMDRISESLLLTYELNGSALIGGGKEDMHVGVVYTNDVYNFVMGYPMESGGFFTRKQLESLSDVIVINKNLSYKLFGSFDTAGFEMTVDAKRFLIVGVVNDGAEENHALVYLPAHMTSRRPNSFMIKIETENGITPAYIEAVMRQFMIAKPDYSFTLKPKKDKTIR